MTAGEMKAWLEDVDDDVELRIASQPNWPFEYDILGLARKDHELETDEDGYVLEDSDQEKFLYIVEGRQIGYTDKELWDNVNRI